MRCKKNAPLISCLLIALPLWALSASCDEAQHETRIGNASAEQTQNTQSSSTMKDSITPENLKKLSLADAIKKYGTPEDQDSFVIDAHLPEFRIELYNYYKEQDYKGKNVKMKEATWPLNENKNVTAWYPDKGADTVPVHVLVWEKDAEF